MRAILAYVDFFKLAAPKSKYVEAILSATQGGEAGVAEIFRTLQLRLRDSTWTIVFKSLIIVHLMIREGAADVTLRYIAESPKRLAISNFADGKQEKRIRIRFNAAMESFLLLPAQMRSQTTCADNLVALQYKRKERTYDVTRIICSSGREATETQEQTTSGSVLGN